VISNVALALAAVVSLEPAQRRSWMKRRRENAMNVELICEGAPIPGRADRDGGRLHAFSVEIQRKTLTRVTPDGKRETSRRSGWRPQWRSDRTGWGGATSPTMAALLRTTRYNGLDVPGRDPGRGCAGGSIQRVDLKPGAVPRRFIPRLAAQRLGEGPNDLVFDAQGGMWSPNTAQPPPPAATTVELLRSARRIEDRPPAQRLDLHQRRRPVARRKTVYVADTYLGRLRAFRGSRTLACWRTHRRFSLAA